MTQITALCTQMTEHSINQTTPAAIRDTNPSGPNNICNESEKSRQNKFRAGDNPEIQLSPRQGEQNEGRPGRLQQTAIRIVVIKGGSHNQGRKDNVVHAAKNSRLYINALWSFSLPLLWLLRLWLSGRRKFTGMESSRKQMGSSD